MSNDSVTVFLDYTKTSAANWAGALDEHQSADLKCLVVHVPWGAHETIRGVRDFRTSSRLRIEKFLSLAHERNLKIHLVVGLFPDPETFPTWTLNSKEKALIPGRFWNAKISGSELIEVPSLRDKEVREGFFDFLNEIFVISALYRFPEGPVVRISVDLSTERLDLDGIESDSFEKKLEARYQAVEQLNVQYGTSFKGFAHAATRKAYKLQSNRRNWLAAYDFQWCRNAVCDELIANVKNLESATSVFDLLGFGEKNSEPLNLVKPTAINFYFDPVSFEQHSGGATLLTVAGIPSLAHVQSFRLYESILEKVAVKSGELIGVDFLPLFKSQTARTEERLVVFCGKYLSTRSYQFLDECLQNGCQVFFPLQLPQYDESLAHHAWPKVKESDGVMLGKAKFFRVSRHAGQIWTPEAFYEYGDDLPTQIILAATGIGHA